MPQIKCFRPPYCATFQMDFVDGPGYIFDETKADYLNWIPVKIFLNLVSEHLTFLRPPTLSVESIKLLLKNLKNLIAERMKVGENQCIDYKFENFGFSATEGEFTIFFENIFDYYERNLVQITIWMNMICCDKDASGFEKGARFCVLFDDIVQFYVELSQQFSELTGMIVYDND